MNVILIYWLMPWINTPKRGERKGKEKKKWNFHYTADIL